MTVVVDTSVAIKWFVRETGREQALRVLDAPERHAPDLIVAEVGNVAWKKAIRGEVTGAQARFICASVRRYFAVLHRSWALIDRASDIALRLRHPIDDCLYLACAERAGARLVTADEKLLAALDGTALASLVVHIDAFTDE
ncbi:MAG: type II toxin-antitoxin system VapC family toxin [Geminicoccaceae bacterium]